MYRDNYDKTAVIKVLNKILEAELAGVVRYTHYSFMVYGQYRTPLVDFFRAQANESLLHAQTAGELLTTLGHHPSLSIGPLLETHQHDVDAILRESLDHEHGALDLYYQLQDLVKDRSVLLEEYARQQIHQEELHLGEVDKMLRHPGSLDRWTHTAPAKGTRKSGAKRKN